MDEHSSIHLSIRMPVRQPAKNVFFLPFNVIFAYKALSACECPFFSHWQIALLLTSVRGANSRKVLKWYAILGFLMDIFGEVVVFATMYLGTLRQVTPYLIIDI